jgi:TRAP-type mannitol/chloroaromatic compound transport system permease large subunit
MLSLIVVAIMLGFPTAFTLMGMGMMFAFAAYSMQGSPRALQQTLDLFVQRAYSVMTNDVLISIPLFVFMGYLVERANLIEKLFKSLHLALARIPGSLAVATLVTCAVFATATGIVGAVVTLMGLLAFPAMLRAGYNVKLSAGVVTAGGCLGILIPPSVMLIVYGATAGVSVVQLYAGAFFPGIMLAGLYVGYVMILAKLKPEWAPPLAEADRRVALPPALAAGREIGKGEFRFGTHPRDACGLRASGGVPQEYRNNFIIVVLPALAFVVLMGLTWHSLTKPDDIQDITGLEQMGGTSSGPGVVEPGGLQEPPAAGGLQEPPTSGGLQEPPQAPSSGLSEPPKEPEANVTPKEPPKSDEAKVGKAVKAAEAAKPGPGDYERLAAPNGFWITLAIGIVLLAVLYATLNWARLEIFKMLLASFFPLAVLILAVLGTIVFGLATPTEAAAVGSLGGFVLAAVYLWYATPDERRRQIMRTWIPLWAVFRGGRDLVPAAQVRGPVGRAAPVGRLDFHGRVRRLVRDGGDPGEPVADGEGVGVPHREDIGHGVLALRGQLDLLGGVRAARRPGNRRALGALARPDTRAVHAPRPGHHLPPGMAARVDGDHRDLHADLHSAARQVQHRPALLRLARGAEPADGVPLSAGRDGRVLPEGRSAAARDAERDLPRDDAVHGIQLVALAMLYIFPEIGLWLPKVLYK